jgi:Zn-finger nucleic acid-binding protein
MNDGVPGQCPECSEGGALVGIPLERFAATVHECPQCQGVWIGRELIERLEETSEADPPPLVPVRLKATSPPPSRFYRPCPVCGALMNRKGCGGVVVDVCGEHGVWFDPGELEPFVAWVQAGKPQIGSLQGALPLAAFLELSPPAWDERGSGPSEVLELVGGVVEVLMAVVEIMAGH